MSVTNAVSITTSGGALALGAQSVSGTGGWAPSAITLPVNMPSAGAIRVKGRASSQ